MELAYRRLPEGSPTSTEADANVHHRDVARFVLLPRRDELPDIGIDIKPGDAWSLAGP